MNETQILKEALRRARTVRNLGSAIAVAEKTVYRWMKGETTPTPRAVRAMLKYIGMSAEQRGLVLDRLYSGKEDS